MALIERLPAVPAVLRAVHDAEGYIASICFKTGPPALTGVELEWTVHHAGAHDRPVGRKLLAAALGPHAPASLNPASPHAPLPGGGLVTVEPGGQVEISTPPQPGLDRLYRLTEADIGQLTALLGAYDLLLGECGIDPHRPPRPILSTPRYAAMARAFDRRGPHGRIMMGSTAGLQVCLDAGAGEQLGQRWRALHALGPPLLAAFANARRFAGRDSGHASMRMAAWLHIDPGRTRPVWRPDQGHHDIGVDRDPAAAWARYAVRAPLLCVRRAGGSWDPPPGVTFADWVAGALPDPPTAEDLEYHLGTLFPPVRPRGYLEVRYLDAQPPGEWIAPVAVLDALLADPATTAEVEAVCAPAADRWAQAARHGLGDRPVAAAARAVLELAARRLDRVALAAPVRDHVRRILRRRLAAARERDGGAATEGSAA